MSTNIITKLLSFGNKPIRSAMHEGQVYWSVVDILKSVLRDDQDASDTLVNIKRSEKQIPLILRKLKLPGTDGKMYPTDCATEEGIFRILQSVNSEKVEDFKLWLAKVGKERLEEEQNPQLAVDRAVRTWKKQGKPEDWIANRLKGIAVRNTTTDTWKAHGIKGDEYAKLTNSLHVGVFNKTVKEHKKELAVTGNLRDNLSRMELIALEFAEAAAEELTKHRNSQGYNEVKKDVKEGSAIGADALSKYKKLINSQEDK